MKNDFEIIKAKINPIICEQLKREASAAIDLQTSFANLGLDSLDVIELIIKLEDVFKRVVSDEVAINFSCPLDLINYFSAGAN